MATEEDIERALMILSETKSEDPNPPAMVVMPPDSGNCIVGNRDGLVLLAVASLKAAMGQEQSFKGKSWVSILDLDWAVTGLKLDTDAHIYLPAKRGRFQRLGQSVLGLVLVLLVVVCLLVGFVTIVQWLLRLH